MTINILYLHGYCGNTELMNIQTVNLRKELSKEAKIYNIDINNHLINALYELDIIPEHQFIRKYIKPPYYGHCYFNYLLNNTVQYTGINETMVYLKNIVKEKKIDGIVAFSQGTYITSLLCSKLELELKFVVYFSGMSYRDTDHRIGVNIPSYHIIGKKDKWYSNGLELYNLYLECRENTFLYEHSGDHHFPNGSDIVMYKDLAKWVIQQCNLDKPKSLCFPKPI